MFTVFVGVTFYYIIQIILFSLSFLSNCLNKSLHKSSQFIEILRVGNIEFSMNNFKSS